MYFNLMTGYRVRCNHWKPGSYWQRIKGDDSISYIRCTDNIQYPLDFNDLSIRYLMCDNWEVITPDGYIDSKPFYN